jgi:MFS transporter, DHA1 family, multidrug resistance protein
VYRPKESAGCARDGDAPAWRIMALLIAMSAIGPLSLNILVPAVPGLAVTLAADINLVQLTVSLYLLGLAACQLGVGPLSDRFGRKPVTVGGLALTAAASLAATAATTIDTLIVARAVQSLGAATGLAISRAMIRDLYDRDRSAAMIGYVTMAMVVAPMIAPLIGGVLDTTFGWQAIFLFIALASAATMAAAALALPESRAIAATGSARTRYAEEVRALVTSPTFIGYALAAALNSATFFAFVGGAPHVVVTIMGRTSAEYGIWFAVGSLSYMAGNYGAGRWSQRLGVDTMVRLGAIIAIVGAFAEVLLAMIAAEHGPATIFLPQMAISLGSGLLLPNALAGAVSVRPKAAGTASGFTGFLQMAIGAAAAQAMSHLLAGASTALPMAIVMLVLALATIVALVGLTGRG